MAEQRDRRRAVSWFAVNWFAWWALMMGFWVAIDDLLRADELIVGAVAAALAAATAAGVGHLAQLRAGFRSAWLPAAVGGVLGAARSGRAGDVSGLRRARENARAPRAA